MKRLPIVAIDGPAGSGKSTIAKQLARRLRFTHIDTGALYRGVALLAFEKQTNLDDPSAVVLAATGAKFSFIQGEQATELLIDGRNVANLIRTEPVSAASSKVSAYPGVRALLLDLQRDLGSAGGVVLEGRDIGTVVFPSAEVKIFLTASIEERARRRAEELKANGVEASETEVAKQVAQRDHQDSTRAIAPLKQAADAILVDTTGLSIEKVLDRLESIVKNAS